MSPLIFARVYGRVTGLLLLLTFAACQQVEKVDEAAIRNEILEMHNLQRDYHLNKMAEEFVSQLSNDHISVNRGEIASPSNAELLGRFKNYFESVEFEKWDDINPPVIKFSDDYSLAYTIVDKDVIVNYEKENGDLLRDSTKFSWVAIYKKYDEGWKIDCVASTNRPSEIIE